MRLSRSVCLLSSVAGRGRVQFAGVPGAVLSGFAQMPLVEWVVESSGSLVFCPLDLLREPRRMALEAGVLGADRLRLHVTGVGLKLSGDEGADRHQYDRLTTIRIVARHGRNHRLLYGDFIPPVLPFVVRLCRKSYKPEEGFQAKVYNPTC